MHFFFEIKQINRRTAKKTLDEFEIQEISYFYFKADQRYYLFFWKKELIDISFIFKLIKVVEQLDSRKRKIRSIRGLMKYALEIIESANEPRILDTNLSPLFWRDVKKIINQNRKSLLEKFLFGKENNIEKIL